MAESEEEFDAVLEDVVSEDDNSEADESFVNSQNKGKMQSKYDMIKMKTSSDLVSKKEDEYMLNNGNKGNMLLDASTKVASESDLGTEIEKNKLTTGKDS